MAATVSQVTSHVPGNLKEVIVDVTGDSSYPTGGYAVTFPGINTVVFADTQSSNAGHPSYYNYATGKLQFFTSGGSEVAAATNLSTTKVRCAVLGY